jgi:uncharacterized membrane protein YhhN
MEFIKRNGISVFFLVLILHCFFVYFSLPLARGISKSLLLPWLMLYLWANTRGNLSILAFTGLVFSFIGDVLLLGKGDLYFLAGMLAFVVTHVCNSAYFVQKNDHNNSRLREAFVAALILMVLSISVFGVLNEKLGSFRIPVLVYMLVISIMAILAAHTASNTHIQKISWNCFIPGAGLFVISDTLLALNKFLFEDPLLDIPVIASYGLAECLLVKGFIAVSNARASSHSA